MTKDFGYRSRARDALGRARTELSSGDETRLKYAALELRMAMEALTYERTQAFRQMLPAKAAVRHWRPAQLLAALAKVDPRSDGSRTLYMAADMPDSSGSMQKEVVEVGTEHVLTTATIEKHYAALSSFLHLPTIAQLESGRDHDLNKFRNRCNDVAAEIDKILASTLYNFVFGRDMTIRCDRCDQEFVIKVPAAGQFSYATGCHHCDAPYHVVSEDGKEVRFRGMRKRVSCLNKACTGTHDVWEDELKAGTTWSCALCEAPHSIDLVIRRSDESWGVAENAE